MGGLFSGALKPFKRKLSTQLINVSNYQSYEVYRGEMVNMGYKELFCNLI